MAQLTVLSLGWGVQSWTLAAMSALGTLPRLDAAVHADTTHERSATYAFAAAMAGWLRDHDIPVVTVTDPAAREIGDPTTVNTFIPAFTLAPRGFSATEYAATGRAGDLSSAEQTEGQLRRQCTGRWKITPMRRWLTAELARRSITKTPGVVEQWLGISLDEWSRAKTSDVSYITHRYPLLEQRLTRAACVAWLQEHGLPVPGKSACVFCPYHNARAWAELKREGGPDWAHARAVDAQVRDARPPYPLFVHRKRVPLAEAVTIPEDHGYRQPDLFPEDDAVPCDSGYCFM
jgi:hypothetical protein